MDTERQKKKKKKPMITLEAMTCHFLEILGKVYVTGYSDPFCENYVLPLLGVAVFLPKKHVSVLRPGTCECDLI